MEFNTSVQHRKAVGGFRGLFFGFSPWCDQFAARLQLFTSSCIREKRGCGASYIASQQLRVGFDGFASLLSACPVSAEGGPGLHGAAHLHHRVSLLPPRSWPVLQFLPLSQTGTAPFLKSHINYTDFYFFKRNVMCFTCRLIEMLSNTIILIIIVSKLENYPCVLHVFQAVTHFDLHFERSHFFPRFPKQTKDTNTSSNTIRQKWVAGLE